MCLFVSLICVNAALPPLCLCVLSSFPVLPGGEEVVWLRSSLTSSWIHWLHICSAVHIYLFSWHYYMLWFVSIAFLSVRVEWSLFWVLLPCWKVFWVEFYLLIKIEGLRTEGAVCCTDGKALWGKLWFEILSSLNKMYSLHCITIMLKINWLFLFVCFLLFFYLSCEAPLHSSAQTVFFIHTLYYCAWDF